MTLGSGKLLAQIGEEDAQPRDGSFLFLARLREHSDQRHTQTTQRSERGLLNIAMQRAVLMALSIHSPSRRRPPRSRLHPRRRTRGPRASRTSLALLCETQPAGRQRSWSSPHLWMQCREEKQQ